MNRMSRLSGDHRPKIKRLVKIVRASNFVKIAPKIAHDLVEDKPWIHTAMVGKVFVSFVWDTRDITKVVVAKPEQLAAIKTLPYNDAEQLFAYDNHEQLKDPKSLLKGKEFEAARAALIDIG